MLGAKIDQALVKNLLDHKFPKLVKHFEKTMFDATMITFKWFTCVFAYNFSSEVVMRLWDGFFIKGDKFMFRITLAFFDHLSPKLL